MTPTHRTADEHAPLEDRLDPRELVDRTVEFSGHIFDVVRDTVRLDVEGEELSRDYMRHPGAVAIVALNERNEILLIRQYRQPAGMTMWEIPAGLLDVEGEPPVYAARRELAEEADLRAEQWHTLLEFNNSPGCSTEANRVFLARGISEVPEDERTFERTGEEAEILVRWVPLEEAVDAVLSARLHSPSANQGILAAWVAVQRGFENLLPPDGPWPAHPRYRDGA